MSANLDVDFEYEVHWRFLLEKDRLERLIECDFEYDLWQYETSNTVH